MLHMVYRSGGCDRSSRHPRAGRISANLTQYVPARRTQKSSPAFRLYEIATILGICKAKRALTERRVNADTYRRPMIRTRSLPRLAPSTVRRSRLERWLATHIAVPLRLLVAPAGSGKTTLLLKYLPNSTVDAAEAELLAETCGVPSTHVELGRLLEESDGWSIVVSGAVRAAAEDGHSLSDAYEHWRSRYGQLFTEFIAAELERAPEEDRALVRSLIAGANVDDQHRLHQLEMQGLFVVAEDDSYRPLRPIRQLRGRVRLAPSARLSPLVVRMFGRFSAQIDNQEISWIRRRDQQFIKYLLLKPAGTATRAELASVVWPDADRQLAAQSVRTACSNIRKAIAAQVGYACVDLYFKADPDVSLNLTNVVADVRRFTAHGADGDAAFDRGDLQEAAVHYRAAEELYVGRLLDGDAPEPWFVSQAQLLEDRYIIVLERLAQTAFDEGDMRSAAEYAYRVRRVRPDSSGLVKMLGNLGPQYASAQSAAGEEKRGRIGA